MMHQDIDSAEGMQERAALLKMLAARRFLVTCRHLADAATSGS